MLIIDASPQLWTPAYLPTESLALWFDALDLSTITLSGSTVSQWRDKSGNNRHATQSNPSLRPIYDFSNNTIFAGTNTFLQLESRLTLTNDATLILLAANNGGNIFVPFDTSNSITTFTNNLKFGWFIGWNGFSTVFTGGNFPNLLLNTSFTGESPAFFSWRRQGTNGLFRYNFNTVSQNFNNTAIEIDFSVGAKQTNLTSAARYYEMLVLNQGISDYILNICDGYFAWKRNFQFRLPTNHPFVNRPPLISDI